MRRSQSSGKPNQVHRKGLFVAVAIAIIGAILVGLTVELSTESHLSFLAPHRNRIVAAEIALFGILIVEVAGRSILQHFRQRDALQVGYAVRTVLRTACYLILVVAIVSLLSSNAALAAGLGSVAGVAIGFAAQNIVGNILAIIP